MPYAVVDKEESSSPSAVEVELLQPPAALLIELKELDFELMSILFRNPPEPYFPRRSFGNLLWAIWL